MGEVNVVTKSDMPSTSTTQHSATRKIALIRRQLGEKSVQVVTTGRFFREQPDMLQEAAAAACEPPEMLKVAAVGAEHSWKYCKVER